MNIFNVRQEKTGRHIELAADISFDRENTVRKLWFRVPNEMENLSLTADPFLAASLIDCMWKDEDIYVEGEVSEKLFNSLETIMDCHILGNSELHKIKIHATKRKNSAGSNQFIGSFFSGGVDSFYTLLKNKEKISHLILVRGFDIALGHEDDKIWDKILHNAKAVAQKYNKQLIPVITNIKYGYNDTATLKFWLESAFGSGCASVGLVFQDFFSEIFIPSSMAYNELIPHGSHPVLDPLWSTEKLEFIHSGCEATRFHKIERQVAKSEMALNTLRVCWENRDKMYNCCNCEKCLRNMTCLEILGKIKDAKSFPEKLDVKKISGLRISDANFMVFLFWKELAEKAKENNKDKLAAAIRRMLRASKRKNLISRYLGFLNKLRNAK